MAIQDGLPSADLPAEPRGRIAVLPPRRERLAIVSTRDQLCGIAAYTHALERYLADIFEVTVFDLDQYLLRGRHQRVRALGDKHIREICRDLAAYDVVNLQLEYGTLGGTTTDICRRFSWLVDAAPRLSVTFHSLKRPPVFPLRDFLRTLVTFNWRTAGDIHADFSRNRRLALAIPKRLRRAQRRKPVSVIVHNRRDLSDARHLHGLDRVFDHPLVFLPAERAEHVRSQASRHRFPLIEPLPANAILIGVFGFLNDYKGFSTAVRALHHLPAKYHLLIFGGTHPNEIPARQPIHAYLASLIEEAYADPRPQGKELGVPGFAANATVRGQASELMGSYSPDLSGRIHFLGTLDDADFLAGMTICDVVVFPYLEVGQSSSGPISIAVELGSRIIASRTHTFLEFAAYHPNTIEFFDIGNHLELAERIAARGQYAARREAPRYNVETNKAVYLAANSPPAPQAPGFHGRQNLSRKSAKAAR
jgi:glycosyltransferase involved in cell wall biosynthesis